MQLTLDTFALKRGDFHFDIKAYGDELTIYATPDSLSLSATNSSKSAYCRFKYQKGFFSKFKLNAPAVAQDLSTEEFEDMVSVTGQLLTKSLLSIMKHRTIEKTVERCEMSIVEGDQRSNGSQGQDEDGLESKLIVRLYCKHGVVKTHRLNLLTPTSLMAPGVPDPTNESNLTIGPKSVKDMIDHFPIAKGPKSDPQLIWTFRETDLEVRSLESSNDAKGKTQLATELTISAEEFDVYNIYATPITIAFHLREFNATIAYADSMTLALDLRFTDPAAPLFIDVEGDHYETLFVISTSQVYGAAPSVPSQNYQPVTNSRKRDREEAQAEPRTKKPMKAAQRVENRMVSVPRTPGPEPHRSPSPFAEALPMEVPPPPLSPQDLMPPPSFIPQHVFTPSFLPQHASTPKAPAPDAEPLFFPSSSQISVVDDAVLRSTGLGIENMDVDELTNMLEGDGEEVAFDFASQDPGYHAFLERPGNTSTVEEDSLEIAEEVEIPPSQTLSESKMFHALFED